MLGISKNEVFLGLAFALMGFVASMRETIIWLNGLDPLAGLVVYYSILYATLFVLAHFGLVIWKFHIKSPMQTLGLLLITFAFFITVNWESCYINTVVSGSCTSVSNVYFGSEDGATYYLWNTLAGLNNPELSRILTFVVTPFVLVMVGGTMVSQKVKLKG